MKNTNDYFLGLDIGTDSLGWAVTNPEYNLKKSNGKTLWGIRLFNSGKTAQERRVFRSARRRLARRVQRIKLLQEIFSEEISKVDTGFYHRIEESKYHVDDKESGKYSLFSDNSFTDKDYYKEYPTIYHLRADLIKDKNKKDIRLIYLALHNIIKNRGHFLFEGQKVDSVPSFEDVFLELNRYLVEQFDIDFDTVSINEIKDTLKSQNIGVQDKRNKLNDLVNASSKQEKAIVSLIAGGTISLNDIFINRNFEEGIIKISFKNSKFEEIYDKISDLLQEDIYTIDKLKAVYDWAILADILKGKQYISDGKVDSYKKHHSDLKTLKNVIKKYHRDEFDYIFVDEKIKDNYCCYIGMTKKSGKKIAVENAKCSQEDFCKFLSKVVTLDNVEDDDYSYIKNEIKNKTLLPKQVVKENSVVPFQVHFMELCAILENASKHYSFLNEIDESKFSAKDKIKKIFSFRIPYYVGPINNYHSDKGGNSWVVKKTNDKVRPWNFDDVIDVEASAEGFITRMTNKCTYLYGEDVLPKESILYSKFSVYNELNNLRINNESITVELKNKIFEELFRNYQKVTSKRLRDYLIKEGFIGKTDIISGFDGDFKSSLKPIIEFQRILGATYDEAMAENIIKWIVLFGGSKSILKQRIMKNYYHQLSEEQISKILQLRYTGWGRLSKKFLTEVYHVDKETGEVTSIITSLQNTNNNLMKLLSHQFDYLKIIDENNNEIFNDNQDISYDMVQELYLSPAIKRSVWQTLLVTKEIVKVAKCQPKKIFIEVAREKGAKKRTQSRKDKLIDLYNKCKEEERDWVNELGNKQDSDLRSDRLYLYYTQMGKCMYSGEPIIIDNLFDKNIYDVDHIHPQSIVKDDSIENRVLVKRVINEAKSDTYPIPTDIQKKCKLYWRALHEKGFIGKIKYERLIRTEKLSNDELASFIARQLVEVRQSSKAIAQIFEMIFPNTEVVYVKAGNISDFRQTYNIIKSRDVNDFHHAKDAYLNIVVGNVYHTKFTSNPLKFISNPIKEKYNIRRMYDFDVIRNDVVAWDAGNDGTFKTILKTIRKNNILFTRHSYEEKGGFFDQTLMKKGKGQHPIKTADKILTNINKYGGYNKISGAYFILVEHEVKNKRIKSIEYVPVYLARNIEKDNLILLRYFENDVEIPLVEPKILVDKIRINTLFKIDGFMMHLSGRTNKQLIFKNAHQLSIETKYEEYIKRISNYIERAKGRKDILKISEFDKITREENIDLYDVFVDKLTNTVYSIRLNLQAVNLKKNKAKFEELDLESQCHLLSEILHFFQCNSVTTNLKLIGAGESVGTILTSKKIDSFNSVTIINQSPTGIFSNKTDLLKT